MSTRSLSPKAIIAIVLLVVLVGTTIYFLAKKETVPTPFAGNPWVRTFDVLRSINVNNVTELQDAVKNAAIGDQIMVADGTYTLSTALNVTQADVMLRCLGHCIIKGNINLTGRNTWLWGFEIYGTGGLVNAMAADTAVINNFIHSDGVTENSVCYFSSSGFSNQVAYGNIVVNCEHDLYLQNDAKSGLEYIIGNYAGPVLNNGNGRIIHAYTQSPNKTEAMYFQWNIFQGTEVNPFEVLFGGENNATPTLKINVIDNLFYRTRLRCGYKRPFQGVIKDNQMFRTLPFLEMLWGDGEAYWPLPEPTTMTGNSLWNPNNYQYLIYTCRYNASGGREVGVANLRPEDLFDNQKFYERMEAKLNAGNADLFSANLAAWQTNTQSKGNLFDKNSQVISGVPPDGFKVVHNEYDPMRAMVAAYSFKGSAKVPITLPGVAELHPVTDPYGQPTVTCSTYPCDVPVTSEFTTYFVNYTGEAVCDLKSVDLKLQEALLYLDQKRYTKTKRAIQDARTILKPCL